MTRDPASFTPDAAETAELEPSAPFAIPWTDVRESLGFLPVDQKASLSLRPIFEDASPATSCLPLYAVCESPALPASDGRAVVALAEILGKGGMGVVNVGEQLSLQRQVAVKRPRPGAIGQRAHTQLMREAVVTGALDHPNIVPVYDLARDEGNRPLLMMKRIEGRSWSSALTDRPRFNDSRWLPWLEDQLEILIQVCNAVDFAHSRGIVHRDLKPDNVMIGHFGEVFVVDWGVAVSLREQDASRFPLLSDSRHIAGTPAYMAPELVVADPRFVDERTDVYLLGGILHEILTGSAPHDADAALASLYQAYASKPATFAADIPERIAAVCQQAMARSPANRFANVAELRQAIRGFLSTRASLHLAETGQRLLASLQAIVGEREHGFEAPTLSMPGEPLRLFTESRFAFRQALDVWPDNDRASEGLAAVIALGVHSAIEHGDLRTARLLLADLPAPDADLQAAVDALAERQRRERSRMARLERLGIEFDLGAGWHSRRLLALALVVVWSVEPITLGVLRVTGVHEPTFANSHAAAGVLLLIVILAGWLGRHSWRATAINRSIYFVAVMMSVATATLRLAMDVGGATVSQSLTADLALYCMAAVGAAAATTDARLLICGAIYLAASLCAGIWPQWVQFFNGAANFFGLGLVIILWRPAAERQAQAMHGIGIGADIEDDNA